MRHTFQSKSGQNVFGVETANPDTMLIKLTDIAKMLSTGPKGAKGWLKKNKIPAIYLGPGRGLGYRWQKQEVVSAILASLSDTGGFPREIEKQLKNQRPFHGKACRKSLPCSVIELRCHIKVNKLIFPMRGH